MDYILARAKQTPMQQEQHLHDLLRQSRIVPTDEHDARFALGLGWQDFEDALQYAAAMRVQAAVIVTANTRHFAASSIPATTASEFLSQNP